MYTLFELATLWSLTIEEVAAAAESYPHYPSRISSRFSKVSHVTAQAMATALDKTL